MCIFYDSILPSISKKNDIDFVSSFGYALGYLGGGLLFLINVLMYLFPEKFGLESQILAIKVSFVLVAVWWLVFSIQYLSSFLKSKLKILCL